MLDPAGRFTDSSFVVDVRGAGTTRTVVLGGEFDLAGRDDFRTALGSALADAPETVVIDLTELEFIDSVGITAILRAHRHAETVGTRLVLVPGPELVQRVFRLCGVETTLPFSPGPAG
jgi:anti-anti-sigma factor